MSVISRTFKSTPARAADETWKAIAAFLVPGMDGPKYEELLSVCGVASSLIADQAPSSSPIIVTCEGPRTHIRCIYDDDAIDGGKENEAPAPSNLLSGDWAMSLPCPAEDLAWVQANLSRTSSHITARDSAATAKVQSKSSMSGTPEMEIDVGSFLS